MGPRRDRRCGRPARTSTRARRVDQGVTPVSKTRLMTAATTAIAGLLLTGCGSASPGVAVKVGDEEISTRHVDEVTANYCTAVGELESAVPMGFVRQYVVQLLTLRSQASQIADDYGVE